MVAEKRSMHVYNKHARAVSSPAEEVFSSLAALGTSYDAIWPAPSMPFERTPGPLAVGETRESHGIIRAVLDELDPGRSLLWRAEQPFLKGTHGFEVTPSAVGCQVEHVLDAHLSWWFAPVWRFKVEAVHDRIIERLFDRIESVVGNDAISDERF